MNLVLTTPHPSIVSTRSISQDPPRRPAAPTPPRMHKSARPPAVHSISKPHTTKKASKARLKPQKQHKSPSHSLHTTASTTLTAPSLSHSLLQPHLSLNPSPNILTTATRPITTTRHPSNLIVSPSTPISTSPRFPPHSTSRRHWGWANDHKWPVKWPKKPVKDVYAGWKPPEFSKENCFFRIAKNGREIGVIEFRLFDSLVPKTAHNFRQLCLGGRKVLDMPLHYRGTRFHRVIKKFMIQGGDITNNDGSGGASVYGRHFPDESFLLTHDRPFLLASANRGPNTNNSGFYITAAPAPWLDGRNVVFGEVVYGQDVVREIEHAQTNPMDTPIESIVIVDCGVVNTNV